MDHNLNNLLSEATHYLAAYLAEVLPSISDDWWEGAVVDKLSFQQRQRVKQKGITSLSLLDLAALLRVLDQNWYQISERMRLPSEARHFVKEMRTVRNRWAHVSEEGFSVDDVYRDLDTLQRFAAVIEAEEAFIQEIRAAKTSLLEGDLASISEAPISEGQATQGKGAQAAEFEPGQIVFLKSNPEMKGAVISVIPGEPENRYDVFVDGKTQIFYASQIQAEDRKDKDAVVLPCHKFHSYLTALQIQHPGLSTLYSLNAARVDFIPYQFRPVLKFIRSDRPRLLIADGVGVGKTIEAGLILRELQARREIQSVLIVCPRSLVIERKWEIEMKRFDERFISIGPQTLRYCIEEMDLDGIWPEQYQKIILPYSLFNEELLYGTEASSKKKKRKGLLELDPPPRFDLVIVDEAHHVRNTDTLRHKAVRFFCDYAEGVIFLTATPIQMGSNDLFVLLNMLRTDLVIDERSFEHMVEPNQYINQAIDMMRRQTPEWKERAIESLDKAASTSWGQAIMRNSPDFARIKNKLSSGDLSPEERIQLLRDTESLHTLARIINRTRRRDIGDFTIRKPETVIVEFTASQRRLHDNLLRIQAEIFSRLHGDSNINFMMTTIRRQAASCLYGLVPFLEDILNRHIDRLLLDEADSDEQQISGRVLPIESEIKAVLEEARSLDATDPKLGALKKILRDKQKLPNNKVMVFSSFRHTLSYLYEHLETEGFRVGLVHGDVPDEERMELRNRFELNKEDNKALDIILFSEVGSEGLDYQFCDCIVNYDLPWNPMKIEQRIGRIDRWGQKSESIAIFNLITPGTVDADIYFRCLWRIGIFEKALGGSEEILGEISKEIKKHC